MTGRSCRLSVPAVINCRGVCVRACGREELGILSQELEAYQPGLSSRCGLIVANKADLPNARANAARLRKAADAAGLRIVPASAKLGDNLSKVVKEMLRIRGASQPQLLQS